MRRKNNSVLSWIISVVGSLLLLALIIAFICRYTDAVAKIKDLFDPTFRVEYDGTSYFDKTRISLPTTGEACFTVKGVENYRILFKPNVTEENDFTYEVGNSIYKFSQTNLSKLFVSENSIRDGSFYLNCYEDYTLESILSKLYDGAEVKVNGYMEYPYLLVFISNDKEISFEISTTRLVLSECNIIF